MANDDAESVRRERQREYLRQWYAKNKERHRELGRRWREANPERVRALARATYHRHKERYRVAFLANPDRRTRQARYLADWKLRRTFGISLSDYETLLQAQGRVCAICGTPPKRKRLAVDHCHQSNGVRGLLCDGCNRGLGYLQHDPAILRKAIGYLERRPA